MNLDQSAHFIQMHDLNLRQLLHKGEGPAAVVQRIKRHFGNDEGVHDDSPTFKTLQQIQVRMTQMINPD